MPHYHPLWQGVVIMRFTVGVYPPRSRVVEKGRLLPARPRLPACYLAAAGRRGLSGRPGATGAAGVSAPPKEGCSDPPPSRLGAITGLSPCPSLAPLALPSPSLFNDVSGGRGGACPTIRCALRIQIHKRGVSPPYDLPLSDGFSRPCRKKIVIS